MKEPGPPLLSISEVERDTGLSKDTLRVWERRYGFPNPMRDASGERVYDIGQLEQLRLIKRLLDRGVRPGKIVGRPLVELAQLGAERAMDTPAALVRDAQRDLLDLLHAHDVRALQQRLSQRLIKHGVHRFITGTLVPLTEAVGDAWAHGDIATHAEHAYTEMVRAMLHAVLHSLPLRNGRPSVLLSTLPHEPHGLGLLMVEVLLAAENASAVALGTETPMPDIVAAAVAHRVDIVALSFSGGFSARVATNGIASLRAALPSNVAIWIGGRLSTRLGMLPPGVSRFDALEQIGPAIERWRAGAR